MRYEYLFESLNENEADGYIALSDHGWQKPEETMFGWLAEVC